MKAFLGSVVCAVAMTGFSVASVGAAAPQVGTAAASDKSLDSRIEHRIHKDPSLKKYDIDVKVDAGVATLTGTVATEADRARAKRLATVNGIARVDNKIIVDLAAAQNKTTGTAGTIKEKTKEGAEKTKEGAEKVAEKTKEGAGKVVEKTKDGLSKTGEVITDGWITTRVKSKFLGEDLLKGSDIDVDTSDHVVTLKGTVMSAAARARANEQAKEVEGVHKVVDLLAIGPKKP
jgi:osmotically-inducible protein OsmY